LLKDVYRDDELGDALYGEADAIEEAGNSEINTQSEFYFNGVGFFLCYFKIIYLFLRFK
jgi:hypothetical protein